MAMTQQECEALLSNLTAAEQSQLLPLVGHELTILGRTAYEFRGPGVTNPRLLRDLNEIQHRLLRQLASLARKNEFTFPPDALAAWLFAEGKRTFNKVCRMRSSAHFSTSSVSPNNLFQRTAACRLVSSQRRRPAAAKFRC